MRDPGVVGNHLEVGQVGSGFESGDDGFCHTAESEACTRYRMRGLRWKEESESGMWRRVRCMSNGG